jgi:hypothetical protein
VWPFATRDLCEKVVKLLAKDAFVRELSPPEERRIHPSTEARGKGFQHERRLWVKNDLNAWHIAKLRQHAQDPSKSGGRSWFEGGFVSRVNSAFAELLRRAIRDGGGRTPGGEELSDKAHGEPKDLSPQQGPEPESPDASGAYGRRSIRRGATTSPPPKSGGGSSDSSGRIMIMKSIDERRGEGCSRTTPEPDN